MFPLPPDDELFGFRNPRSFECSGPGFNFGGTIWDYQTYCNAIPPQSGTCRSLSTNFNNQNLLPPGVNGDCYCFRLTAVCGTADTNLGTDSLGFCCTKQRNQTTYFSYVYFFNEESCKWEKILEYTDTIEAYGGGCATASFAEGCNAVCPSFRACTVEVPCLESYDPDGCECNEFP